MRNLLISFAIGFVIGKYYKIIVNFIISKWPKKS